MQTIGESLLEARKRRGITIREAAEATKIRSDYLNHFENNNFNFDIPEIYTRGFLRSYANYLKLNTEKIVTDYNALLIGEGKPSKRESREFFGRLELQQPIIEEAPGTAGEADEPRSEGEPAHFFQSALSYLQTIEKDLWIKIGIAAALSLILIISLIWGISAIVNSEGDATLIDDQPLMTQEIVPFALIAKEDIRVDVTQINPPMTLFQGTIAKGTEQPLEALGSIRINCSDSENLRIRIGDKPYRAPVGRASFRITPAKQLADQRSGQP